MTDKPDPVLEPWSEVAKSTNRPTLLLGNGASRAVWEGFAYESLFDVATSENDEHRLERHDIALFEEFATHNFELVLSHLAIASRCAEALSLGPDRYASRYTSIKKAMIEAVKTKHVPWLRVPKTVLLAIRTELLNYESVFTTNYDLLLYWAVMHEDLGGFKDVFWSDRFDPLNTDVWDDSTVIYYLHGGLHLYKTETGQTIKRKAEEGRNLLDLFGAPMAESAEPLVVAEGSSKDKMNAIRRSDYLSFAYSELVKSEGGLVVFGQSLGETDQHLIDAVRRSRAARIAVGVRPGSKERVIARKAQVIEMLPLMDIRFFDATTHPLGSAALRVKP